MNFKTFLIPTLIQFVAWMIFYYSFGDQAWYKNNIQQVLFAACISLIGYIIGTITLFFRPVFIKVQQSNIMGDSKETSIDIQKEKCKTLQNQRTISLNIQIDRRGSIWWRIFNILLKNTTVKLKVSLKPPKLAVIQESFLQNVETNETQGFNIILNPYLNELFEGNSNYGIDEKHRYYISYQKDFHEVTNSSYIIDPLILVETVNQSKLKWIKVSCLKWLLKRDIESHKIKIIKR
jgi:hypothetical protein